MPKSPPTSSPSFAALLMRLSLKYPTRKAFARAVGVNPTRLSRAINGDPVMFNVLHCLRLARVTGEPPGVVLRAAGKHEIADLLDELYATQHEVARLLDACAPEIRAAALGLLRGASGRAAYAGKRHPSEPENHQRRVRTTY